MYNREVGKIKKGGRWRRRGENMGCMKWEEEEKERREREGKQ
jgi:hypothetical protein